MQLQKKVAIVTGGARGIGRATTVALASAGVRAVVIVDLREAAAAETASLARKAGSEASSMLVDVSDSVRLRDVFIHTKESFGSVDVLVNCAGLPEGADEWTAASPARCATVIDVNLRAVVVGTRLALEAMAGTRGGAIVNVASTAGLVPLPEQAVYAASKAGVIHFTRSCARLAQTHNVRVSCICPGLVATEMLSEAGSEGRPPWLEPIVEVVELLTPEEVAGGILDLVRAADSGGAVRSIDNRARIRDER